MLYRLQHNAHFLAIGFNTYSVLSRCATMVARFWKRPLTFFGTVILWADWITDFRALFLGALEWIQSYFFTGA
ncbi:hypothetical protein Plhal304r1_c001g0002201 [Plasmopara halstedii]